MSGVIASMLILSSSVQSVSSQVSPVNAATPSTLGIVGMLFLAGMVILALILVWVNISEVRERVKELGRLDIMTICHILCTLLLLLSAVIVLSDVVGFIASII